jgi:aconitate hydratase
MTARAAAVNTPPSPRLLGGVAAIVRSFAPIHESNLKRSGLLALRFSDPAHDDRIRHGDHIGLIGLSACRWSEAAPL